LPRRKPIRRNPLHPTDTGRQLGTQETGVGRLVRDAPDGGQPKIDRGRRISALFEVNPVSKHDGAVKCETRLRTVPGDELANRGVVGSLATGGCQAVEDGCLGVFEVLERQDALRWLLLARFRLRASATASFTVADSFTAVSLLRQ
jgi:hypothetical protein